MTPLPAGDPAAGQETAPRLDPAMSRGEALRRIRRAFAQAGLDSPALDGRLLLGAVLGLEAAELLARPEPPLGAAAAALEDKVRRRLAREPLARILGEREFWGLPFGLSPETLVPRPDSETVVEAALACCPDRTAPLRILDLGTGSGCLLVALLHELCRATGIGLDRSTVALRTAQRNADRNGVGRRAGFVASDWGAALDGRFDLVVANPPYIATPMLAGLAPEVRRHDPGPALDGGPDGLAAYRIILRDGRRLLAPGGTLVLEVGYDQENAVRQLGEDAALLWRRTVQDLAGHPRAVVLGRES